MQEQNGLVSDLQWNFHNKPVCLFAIPDVASQAENQEPNQDLPTQFYSREMDAAGLFIFAPFEGGFLRKLLILWKAYYSNETSWSTACK